MSNSTLPKLELWNRFIATNRVIEDAAPLFKMEGNCVASFAYGSNERTMLMRSSQMELLMRSLGRQLVGEFNSGAIQSDGILYVMMTRLNDSFVPRYIGKAELLGRGDHNLSANIKDLINGTANFGRWGYNYAYHIGDLSACCFSNHEPKLRLPKYERWRNALFDIEGETVRLKTETLFWAGIWSKQRTSIWREYSPTRLAFEEYLLIGVASDLFPEYLLNSEGRNRVAEFSSNDPA